MHSSTLSRFSSDTLLIVLDSRLVTLSSNGMICLISVFILCLGCALMAAVLPSFIASTSWSRLDIALGPLDIALWPLDIAIGALDIVA